MKYALVRETQDPHECKLVSLHDTKEKAVEALEKTCRYLADQENCNRKTKFEAGQAVGKRVEPMDFAAAFFIAGP